MLGYNIKTEARAAYAEYLRGKKDFSDEYDKHMNKLNSSLGVATVNTITDPWYMANFIKVMLCVAAYRSLNAGYSGASNDGGASDLVNCLYFMCMGARMEAKRKITAEFQEVVNSALIESDPDFQKYKELHKKFNGVKPE